MTAPRGAARVRESPCASAWGWLVVRGGQRMGRLKGRAGDAASSSSGDVPARRRAWRMGTTTSLARADEDWALRREH